MHFHNDDDLDFSLSKIVFGGASISGEAGGYGFGNMSENDAIHLIRASYEQGINVFDTAPIYGFHASEIRLGLALKNWREKAFIVSKAGVTWHDNMRVDMNNDPKVIQKMLEQSLRNLDSDYIDLYMIHWPASNVDIRYSLEVLAHAQIKGQIKHIGLCNTHTEDFLKAKEVVSVKFLQSECNLFKNKLEQIEGVDEKMITMGWGSFDKGILTGKLNKDSNFEASDCRSWAPWWKKSGWREKVKRVDELKVYIEKYSPVELAASYSLANVDLPIFGFRNLSQLESILSILDKKVENSVLEQAVKFVRK